MRRRGVRTAAAALTLFLVARASPAQDAPSAQARVVAFLEGERDAIDPLQARVDSLLGRLGDLRSKPAPWLPSRAMLREREALRRETEEAFREYRLRLSSFRGRLDEYEQLSFVSSFSRFMSGETTIEKVAGKITGPSSARAYSRSHELFLRRFEEEMAVERASFDALLLVRRRRLRGLWAGGGLLAAGAAVLLLRPRAPAKPATAAASAAAGVPMLAERWRLERVAGKNRLGSLYDAVDIRDGSPVRVWVLDLSLGVPEAGVRSLAETARRGQGLQDPAFSAMLAVLHEGKGLGLVTRRPEGVLARETLRPGAAGYLSKALGILAGAAAALEKLHSAGAVHGGFCPANLFLSPEGSVRVWGLGVPCVGDPAYLAPEHPCALCDCGPLLLSEAPFRAGGAAGSCAAPAHFAPAARSTDVFGLAATAYALLTRRPPFPGPDIVEQKRLLALPRLSGPGKELTPVVEAVLLRGLSPDPARRFASCREFAAALRA